MNWTLHSLHQLRDGHLEAASQGFERCERWLGVSILEAGNVLAADTAFSGEIGLAPAATLAQPAETLAKAKTDRQVPFWHCSRMRERSTTARDTYVTRLITVVSYHAPEKPCMPRRDRHNLLRHNKWCSHPRFCALTDLVPNWKLPSEIKANQMREFEINSSQMPLLRRGVSNEPVLTCSNPGAGSTSHQPCREPEPAGRVGCQPGTDREPERPRLATLPATLRGEIILRTHTFQSTIPGLTQIQGGKAR
jgi:hypothetical protein